MYTCMTWRCAIHYSPLSGTTRVSRYQKKHSPTQHPDHHPIFISFFHLPRSIASSQFKLRAWQSFCTTSLHVIFGLPLGLEPSTSFIFHIFLHPIYHLGSKLIQYLQICTGSNIHTCMTCTDYRIRATSTKMTITLYMLPFIPLHFLCTHFWQLVPCIKLLPTPLPHTPHGHVAAFWNTKLLSNYKRNKNCLIRL